jgi:hypothetical protein
MAFTSWTFAGDANFNYNRWYLNELGMDCFATSPLQLSYCVLRVWVCGDIGVAVGNRCNVFPEGFLPTCAGGKDLCGAGAAHGL